MNTNRHDFLLDIFALSLIFVFLFALGWVVFKFALFSSPVLIYAIVLLFMYIVWVALKQCL